METEENKSRRCWCGRVFLVLLLLGVITCVVGYLYRAQILTAAARAWVIDEPARKSDAILVLGGGVGWRPVEAARLFTSGYAPKVLVTSVRPDTAVQSGLKEPEQELVAAVLESKGVPASAITRIGNASSSTFGDIQAAANWARTNQATDLLIPTDLFHTRRVKWTAEHLLASSGTRAHVLAFNPPDYSITNWWANEEGLITFQNEVVKSLLYLRKY